jgi:hypothetical protein
MKVSLFQSWTPSRLTAIVLSALMGLAIVAGPVTGVADNVTVIVDGQTMSFDQPPILRAGRVFVPLRGVFERLGASVVYANGQINATAPGRTVSLTIGSTAAVVNGQNVTVDVAPFLVGDRTLVPLRFIAQSLGATVNWNDSNSTVTIASGRGPRQTAPPPNPQTIAFTYKAPTGTVYNRTPQIRFSISRPVRIGTFRIFLDGRDVTSGLQWNGQYFFENAPFALPYGQHRVRVYGRTQGGVPFDLTWAFTQGTPP